MNSGSICDVPVEPSTVTEALADPRWKKAMNEEFAALMRNITWSLVSPIVDMNVVSNKWGFRVKYNKDGTVDRFKAHLVAKVFSKLRG